MYFDIKHILRRTIFIKFGTHVEDCVFGKEINFQVKVKVMYIIYTFMCVIKKQQKNQHYTYNITQRRCPRASSARWRAHIM